ncbi:MAG: hypothetical protein ACKO3G_03880, partial [Planctomycetaceae bacterium]
DDLPAGLVAIVDRLLAKAPGERFQTPGELLQALEAIEAECFPGSRRQLPLEWSDGIPAADGQLRTGAEDFRERSSHGGTRSGNRPRPSAAAEVREATLRLQATMARDRFERDAARRFWLGTAAAMWRRRWRDSSSVACRGDRAACSATAVASSAWETSFAVFFPPGQPEKASVFPACPAWPPAAVRPVPPARSRSVAVAGRGGAGAGGEGGGGRSQAAAARGRKSPGTAGSVCPSWRRCVA